MRNVMLVLSLLLAATLSAQTPAPTPVPPANSIPCLKTGQPLVTLPVLGSDGTGVLRGNLYTVSEQVRMTSGIAGAAGGVNCYPQWVRAYRLDEPTTWNP
ncbi:MAG TPA: hypothetical protein VF698_20325, partial [Thermoanaerobaculia bacterium]